MSTQRNRSSAARSERPKVVQRVAQVVSIVQAVGIIQVVIVGVRMAGAGVLRQAVARALPLEARRGPHRWERELGKAD